jgi:hypothetical protein
MQRRPRLSRWHATFQITAGLLVCGTMSLLALVSVCCDAVDALLARVVIPFASPLLFAAVVSQLFNDASVVYDREGISRARWFGRYGVKNLRWQDIVHVRTVKYRRGSGTTVILYSPGTRIVLHPTVYANRAKFYADLMRHLDEHVPPSEHSTVLRG